MSGFPLAKRLKEAASEWYKTQDNDLTHLLLDLEDSDEWIAFLPELSDGLTDYRTLYRDPTVGIYLFRSKPGAVIGIHHHRFAERIVFIQGEGSIIINREERISLNTEKSIFVPAGTLHEGVVPKTLKEKTALSVCVFYYYDASR